MDEKDYVTHIQKNYTPKEHTKLDELKALDSKVKLFPAVLAYIVGTVAALILGVGLCLAMKVIGAEVMSDTTLSVLGVVIGCVGIVLCVANYYLYKAVLFSRKKKYSEQIINLSNELLNK